MRREPCQALDAPPAHPHAKAGVSGWGGSVPRPWSTAFPQEPSTAPAAVGSEEQAK